MRATLKLYDFVPQNVPQNMSGKLSYRICIKKDHVRTDGTSALYIDIYYNKKRKRVNMNISVPLNYFDEKKQRVKKNYKYAVDYNLLIEKVLSDLNSIEITYRLNDEIITLEKVVEDFTNPSLRVNYNSFASNYLEYQHKEGVISPGTYRQQKSFCEKIKRFKDPLLFSEIDAELLERFRVHLKTKENNSSTTIETAIKNFKKFLHVANSKGVKTQLDYSDISVKSMKGDFTFLLPKELKQFYEFYKSPFINTTWKNILQRYLFSCFTGLRISDIELITEDNFIGEFLVWNQKKGDKLNRIKLNKVANELVTFPHVFNGNYTREHINRELKLIAKACNIKKRVYFHSSRHTFATNYLISGGTIRNLQKQLGHSKIETTMIYAHVVDSLLNSEMDLMDDLILKD